tara:strand:- start:158 stop:481 length:324 start_codon:yes stop_codon:yes gene_type:complete
MSFSENERTLQVIQSEIKKLNRNLATKISKKKLKSNEFLREVNENIIELQKNIFEEKLQQLEQINKLYEYLESHYDENKEGIIFQQKKLNKLRSKLKQEIEKYLGNI